MATINPKDWLIFVDTNILLDFYRARNDANVTLLAKIDKLHSQLITTRQVEMEFKKNRQRVIVDCLKEMKPPEAFNGVPAFLQDAKSVGIIKRSKIDVDARVKDLKRRSIEVLSKPTLKDEVYKITQRMFADTTSDLILREGEDVYDEVVREADKRHGLGYPPRKKEDTSYGDAVNWEWVLRCSNSTGKHVVIVSRDSDYGSIYNKECFINDWLQQEFRARTSKQRKLILTDRLSVALKIYAHVEVTEDEIEAENDQIEEAKTMLSGPYSVLSPSNVAQSGLETLIQDIERRMKEIQDRQANGRKIENDAASI